MLELRSYSLIAEFDAVLALKGMHSFPTVTVHESKSIIALILPQKSVPRIGIGASVPMTVSTEVVGWPAAAELKLELGRLRLVY